MPGWDEYKQQAKARGALAMELYVVVSTPSGDPEKVRETLADHLAYQKQTEAEGKLVMAGPLSDDTGELMQGAGMIIYRAASMEDCYKLAGADPMHKNGARSFTLRRWLVNEGALSFQISLSDQSVKLAE